MTNTSATGGYLVPADVSSPPLTIEDDPFLDFMHDVIAGITGLANEAVRPRWQPEPPNIPERLTSWVAFGVTGSVPDQTGMETHYGDDQGRTALTQQEDTTLLLSFYGRNAEALARRMRGGLLIGQNRDAMTAAGVAIRSFLGPVPAPVMMKTQWLYRSDLTITLRRNIQAVYPILNIVEAVGTITTEDRVTPFDTGA